MKFAPPALSIGVLVSVTIAGAVVGIILLLRERADKEEERHQREFSASSAWDHRIAGGMENLVTAARGLEGLVRGASPTAPDHYASVEERIRGQNISAFDAFAPVLYKTTVGLVSIQLLPSGVVAQMYPPGSAHYLEDQLNHVTYGQPVLNGIKNGNLYFLNFLRNSATFEVRIPVFCDWDNMTLATWWGDVAAVMAADVFLDQIGLSGQGKVEWVVWANVDDQLFVIGSSNGTTPTNTIIAKGTTLRVQLPESDFYLSVYSDLDTSVSGTDITRTIALSFFIALVVTVAMNAAFLIVTHEYVGLENAPKQTPFVCVVISIARVSELWAQLPDEALSTMDKMSHLVAKAAKQYKMYVTTSVSQQTTTVVGRSVESGVRFAFDLLEVVEAASWPDELVEILNVPFPQLRISIHYCTMCQATFDPEMQKYLYEGPDFFLAAKIHKFAPAGAIIASQHAHPFVAQMPTVVCKHFHMCHINPGEPLLTLHTIDKRSNVHVTLMNVAGLHVNNEEGPLGLDEPALPSDANEVRKQLASIPPQVESTLRAIAEKQMLSSLQYKDLEECIALFYTAFSFLFRGFATAERNNIQLRLCASFGLPVKNFVENLAVRCVFLAMGEFEERSNSRPDSRPDSPLSSKGQSQK